MIEIPHLTKRYGEHLAVVLAILIVANILASALPAAVHAIVGLGQKSRASAALKYCTALQEVVFMGDYHLPGRIPRVAARPGLRLNWN